MQWWNKVRNRNDPEDTWGNSILGVERSVVSRLPRFLPFSFAMKFSWRTVLNFFLRQGHIFHQRNDNNKAGNSTALWSDAFIDWRCFLILRNHTRQNEKLWILFNWRVVSIDLGNSLLKSTGQLIEYYCQSFFGMIFWIVNTPNQSSYIALKILFDIL